MNAFTLIPSLTFLHPTQWSFKNFITATSLQIAVAGVAAAIFASQSFLAAGFVIMGASVAYLGITGARFDAIIQQMSGKIAQDVETIETHTNTITDLTQKLASQTQLFNENHTKIQQEISAFKQENRELKKAQLAWELERKQLEANNQTLSQTKTSLENEVHALNENYKGIGAQVKQFLASHQEMGQNIKDLQKGEEALAIFIISSFATPSAVIKPLDFSALFEPTSALACAA